MEQARVVRKPKVIFVLGATATGKSKLAIAIAKRFNGEVINADKIQVYDGVPIITNKVTEDEQDGVPHHLLSVLPPDAKFTAEDFRRAAAVAVARVLSSAHFPVVAGGSNTYIEELVEGDGAAFRRAYDVLFLWVDAKPELLERYAALRVDDMVARGLVDEVRAVFDVDRADYSRGVHRAIGLPEMHAYLLAERAGEANLEGLLARAVREIKENTFSLARAQVEKIRRLSTLEGWDVRCIDVSPLLERMAEGGAACDGTKQIWETLVWQPCEDMVRCFLDMETPTSPIIVEAIHETKEQARAVEKPKVIFVLGATATGKSKLAIAIAKGFSGDVINADKIQMHDGLPVITNKVTEDEKDGVPHHLLSVLPSDAEFTAADFRREAAGAVARVLSSGRLPIVAGGSNRFIEELVEGDGAAFRRAHNVLFVWVDAAPELLQWYTALRVDDMMARGLVDEVRAVFDADRTDYSSGVRRAIGLPEMHAYLIAERAGEAGAELEGKLARAVREIKDNTFSLARSQVEKIRRLSTLDGWDVRRIDVTPVFVRMAESGGACDKQTWEAFVWQPCEEMVRRFLNRETPAAPVTVDGNASVVAGGGVDGETTALSAGTDGDSGGASNGGNAKVSADAEVAEAI